VARELWLLRHGDAEPAGERDDAARRLTERGQGEASAAGAALARLSVEFDCVFTSPRVRARETAAPVGRALGLEPVVHEPLSGGFARDEALELLAGFGAEAKLLLVGHEPDLSQLVRDLTGARTEMKKGAVAGIRIGRGEGELLVLLRAPELRAMAAS
jgi:phosphohistidine phosphatase